MKKILSLLLCLVILFISVPTAFANDDTDTVQSTLPEDTVIKSGQKYYISTVDDLKALVKIVNEDGNKCEGASFWLTNDIVVNSGEFSLSESGEPLYNNKPVEECTDLIVLESIGNKSSKGFKGTFLGDGHTISGLYLNSLFGTYFQPTITNLSIKNSFVTSKGILADTFSNSGYISNCSVEGIVICEDDKVGLYAGSMLGTSIRDCYAEGYVKGNSIVGGFAGYMSVCEVSGTMSNSHITASSTAGGFAGKITGDDTLFEHCAAIGTVNCADETAGQFASSIDLYYFDNGYDILRTLNISYAAVETNNNAGFCHSFTGDTAGVNQCYYMGEKDEENIFKAYTEEEMKTTSFVDVLHADIFAQLEEYPMEWGYFGIYFAGKSGEFPVPFGLHYDGIGVPSCDYGEWEMYSSSESRQCIYYACDGIERRSHYHTWGEYVYNNDAANDVDGTKTAHCTKEGCNETNTLPDEQHLRLNAVPLSEAVSLEKGKLYTISNFDEWKIFTEICTQDTADVSFALINDIEIHSDNGYKMQPIETFCGTFDGLGHSLTNVEINTEQANLTGIFALCDGAEIRNINISGKNISGNSEAGEATAVLCAKAINSKFENCSIECSVTANNAYTGGVIGYAETCEIIGCRNLSTVEGSANSCIGGVIGKASNCTIEECCNQGDIAGGKTTGGLIGYIDKCRISYCYNTGNIAGNNYAGGFAGGIYPIDEDNTINYCYTAGTVTASYSGKFCGSYNTSNIFAMNGCFFVGNDVSEADSDGIIDLMYDMYRDSLYDDGYNYAVWEGKDLGISAFSEATLKMRYSDGSEKFIGDGDNTNKGFAQLRRFHTEHIWGEYKLTSDTELTAECVFGGCRYTNTQLHEHCFEDYIVNPDKSTETAECSCGETNIRNHKHEWGEYIYNNDADCKNNGTKTAVCIANGCGTTNSVEDTEHPAKGHNFNDFVPDENGLGETAFCQNEGCTETVTREYKVAASETYDVTAIYSQDCFNEEVTLEVSEIIGGREPGGIYMVEGNTYKQIGIYNIKTVSENGNVVQPNDGFTVTVKMHLPDDYKERTDVVIYHHFTDGGREKLSSADGTLKVENGYIIFEVSRFSEFEILLPAASAEITKLPDKTKYIYKSSAVDLSGIEITITEPDGTVEVIEDISLMTVDGFDSNTTGLQTVTVTYEEYSVQLEVEVYYSWWQWIIRIILLGFFWL